MTINDIYAGKPDAKDEVKYNGIESLLQSLVIPQGFDFSKILNDDKFFITGLKGTGKTALLYYLESRYRSIDQSTCSSFIFFNDDYPRLKRDEINNLSKRITSSIIVDNSVLLGGDDYEYIWKWLLYYRISTDNEEYEENLFVNDEHWEAFTKCFFLIQAAGLAYHHAVRRVYHQKRHCRFCISSRLSVHLLAA